MVLPVNDGSVFVDHVGPGIAVAVLVDAAIVRATFVAPRPLARSQARCGLCPAGAATA